MKLRSSGGGGVVQIDPGYPKFKYHASLPAKIVFTAAEEQALGDSWKDSPADFQPDAVEEELGYRIVKEDLPNGRVRVSIKVTVKGLERSIVEADI